MTNSFELGWFHIYCLIPVVMFCLSLFSFIISFSSSSFYSSSSFFLYYGKIHLLKWKYFRLGNTNSKSRTRKGGYHSIYLSPLNELERLKVKGIDFLPMFKNGLSITTSPLIYSVIYILWIESWIRNIHF